MIEFDYVQPIKGIKETFDTIDELPNSFCITLFAHQAFRRWVSDYNTNKIVFFEQADFIVSNIEYCKDLFYIRYGECIDSTSVARPPPIHIFNGPAYICIGYVFGTCLFVYMATTAVSKKVFPSTYVIKSLNYDENFDHYYVLRNVREGKTHAYLLDVFEATKEEVEELLLQPLSTRNKQAILASMEEELKYLIPYVKEMLVEKKLARISKKMTILDSEDLLFSLDI